jgi:signal transduction histidine kinase
MLIKTQLRLAALLPVVFALVVGGVLWRAKNAVDDAQENAELADKAQQSIFSSNVLVQEYLLFGGRRAEVQLAAHHLAIGELLARLAGDKPEERELIADLQQDHRQMGDYYRLLFGGAASAQQVITGAMLLKFQDERSKAGQYASIQHQQVIESQRSADVVVLTAVFALAVLSVTAMALLARRVTAEIAQLGAGVAQVAQGQFGHEIPLCSTDELGVLADNFNGMSRQLRDSYMSIEQLEARVHQRTAELEAANKELEAFSYSVSHDLRAPLRAIDGFSRKLVTTYGNRLDDEGRRLLQVVRDNAQRMGQLIDDLLGFSRMGRREMSLQPLDLDAIAKGVADELRAAEPQRGIEFAFSLLPRAMGDAAMLRQVWVNLLGNAVKFSSRRPLAHIEVGGRAEGGEAIYWVKDDGAGFDMRYADKLFGVFQRLHRQDEFAGTGVGLAIVQRILARHHGRIWAESQPDAGATFWFALPLQSAADQLSGAPTT